MSNCIYTHEARCHAGQLYLEGGGATGTPLRSRIEPCTCKQAMSREPVAWLVDLGHELRTQDGRITADPYFLVQEEVRDHGYDPDYSDTAEWVNAESDYEIADAKQYAILDARDGDGHEDDAGWVKVYYQTRWEFVQAFLTEKGANAYIECNAHRHTGPLRTYAESAHRNTEIKLLRRALARYEDKGGADE